MLCYESCGPETGIDCSIREVTNCRIGIIAPGVVFSAYYDLSVLLDSDRVPVLILQADGRVSRDNPCRSEVVIGKSISTETDNREVGVVTVVGVTCCHNFPVRLQRDG